MNHRPFGILLVIGMLCASAPAADLPTISVDHLYYLRARSQYLRRLKPDEMIEYCAALKLGGSAFESLYAELFTMRVEVTKLLRVDEVVSEDPRVRKLNKTHDACLTLLREEAQKIQNGLVREGVIAADTLEVIAKDTR